jgi:hypothetical protein
VGVTPYDSIKALLNIRILYIFILAGCIGANYSEDDRIKVNQEEYL